MSNESLSALLDGEVSSVELDRILREMEQSPALAERWSRLCQRRDAQEGVRILRGQACICAGVMAGLDAAPEAVAAAPKVVELASRRRLSPQVWKPLAGFAAAASVAAISVLVIRPDSNELSTVPEQRSSRDLTPSINVNNPIRMPTLSHPSRGYQYQTVSVRPKELQNWAQNDDGQTTQLRDFLVDHSDAIAAQGVGGTLRYARFEAHTAQYRPEATDGQR